MGRKFAVIDLGTNTFHLLIAEIKNSEYEILHKVKEPVRLAEEGIVQISDAALMRALKTMVIFKKRIEEYGVEEVWAFGTAAFREAENGKDLLRQAKEYFGIETRQISGDKEAALIYYGVRQAVHIGTAPTLIMDIGGGSVELIIADEDKIFWKGSFKIGAAILRKEFHHEEPISAQEIKTLENFLEKELQPLTDAIKKFPVKKLVGASGAFDTLAEMVIHRFYNDDISVGILHTATCFDIKPEYFRQVHSQLLQSTLEERLRNKAIVSFRADMIVVSSILIDFVIRKAHAKEIKLSTFALKEGVLWCLQNGKTDLLFT